MPDIPADNEGYEEREVEYNETLIQTIKQALNELSDGYRVIFSLNFFEATITKR
jgi:predicted nuclease of restriction endonuclease-like (RecB) superfamily